MCYQAHSSAGLLPIEIEGVAKGCPSPDTRSKSNCNWDQLGGKWIFSAEHRWVQHYFYLFSAASVILSRQGSFYNDSAVVSTPGSEDGRHLCRCLTPLSLILVVSTFTCRLGRSKQKAYAIKLLPSRSWGCHISQLAKLYKVCLVKVAFTLTEQLSHIPVTYDIN